MTIDVNNIVRTVLIAAVVAPLSFSLAGLLSTQNEVNRLALDADPRTELLDGLKAELQLPWHRYEPHWHHPSFHGM